jgi:hypothetical protein
VGATCAQQSLPRLSAACPTQHTLHEAVCVLAASCCMQSYSRCLRMSCGALPCQYVFLSTVDQHAGPPSHLPTNQSPWQLAERKDENGQTAYFVKWKGYEVDPAESGWLTEEGMDDVRARLVGRA